MQKERDPETGNNAPNGGDQGDTSTGGTQQPSGGGNAPSGGDSGSGSSGSSSGGNS